MMTVAHLVFALATSIYMLIAIQFEEHDLQNAHPEYRDYKKRVPMLIPSVTRLVRPKDDAAATDVAK